MFMERHKDFRANRNNVHPRRSVLGRVFVIKKYELSKKIMLSMYALHHQNLNDFASKFDCFTKIADHLSTNYYECFRKIQNLKSFCAFGW